MKKLFVKRPHIYAASARCIFFRPLMRIRMCFLVRRAPKTAIVPGQPPSPRPLVRAHLLVTVVVFILYLGRNYALLWGKFSIECLRAQTTRTKTPVLAIIFRVPMTSVSPYLNPQISDES